MNWVVMHTILNLDVSLQSSKKSKKSKMSKMSKKSQKSEKHRLIFRFAFFTIGIIVPFICLSSFLMVAGGKKKSTHPAFSTDDLFYATNVGEIEQVRSEVIKEFEKLVRNTSNKKLKAEIRFKLLQNYQKKFIYLRNKQMQDRLESPGKRISSVPINNVVKKITKTCASLEKSKFKFGRMDQVYFLHALALKEMQKPSKANIYFNKVVKKFPRSDKVASSLFMLAEYYFRITHFRKALSYYKRVSEIKSSPLRSSSFYKMGWCYYKLSKYKKSLNAFKKMIKVSKLMRSREDGQRLREVALEEMLIIWAEVGTFEDAKRYLNSIGAQKIFFKNIPYFASRMIRAGKIRQGIKVHKYRIKQLGMSKKAPDNYREILTQSEKIANRSFMFKEVMAFIDTYGPRSKWAKHNRRKSFYEKKAKDIEKVLLSYIQLIHKEAQKQNNNQKYALAQKGYSRYRELYPKGRFYYDALFFSAEINFYLARKENNTTKSTNLFCKAARNYKRVASLTVKGKYFKSAAKSMLVSVSLCFDQEWKKIRKRKYQFKGKPIALSPKTRMFLQGCKLFGTWFPSSVKYRQCKFDIVEIYLKNRHFSRAEKQAWDVIQLDKKRAVVASELILKLHEHRADKRKIARKLVGLEHLYGTKLRKNLIDYLQGQSFERARALEKKGNFKLAANEFYAFYKKYSGKKDVLKALYNAALNYEKASLLYRSLQVYQEVVGKKTDKKVKTASFEKIAVISERLMLFAKASEAYHVLFRRYTDQKKKRIALYNSAVMADLSGSNKGEVFYSKLIKTFPSSEESIKASYNLIELCIINKQPVKLKQIVSKLLPKLRIDKAKRIVLYGRAAHGWLLMNNLTQANSLYMKILSLGPPSSNIQPEARRFYAEAMFRKTMKSYNRVGKVIIRAKSLNSDVEKKLLILREVTVQFDKVLQIKDRDWSLASLVMLGELYWKTAKDIDGVSLPSVLKPEDEKAVRDSIKNKVTGPMLKKANMYILEAKKIVRMQNTFSEYNLKLYELVNKLQPDLLLVYDIEDFHKVNIVDGILFNHQSVNGMFGN